MSTALLTALLCLPSSVPDARQDVLVVIGAEGQPEYGEAFRAWAQRIAAAASQGEASYQVIGDASQTEDSRSDREQLQQRLSELADGASAPLWLILIGHGTFDGQAAKFNLRGPDMSAEELQSWLAPLARPVAVINCSSSSGPFINRLAAPNRIVITATKSGYEQNYARFGDYFSAALADPEADLDKDQQTSLLEAFVAASRKAEEFYDGEGRLATEHALLDDNGDGQGTPGDWFRGVRAVQQAEGDAPLDGLRAHQWHLVRSPLEEQLTEQQRARRDELEAALEELRSKKGEMTADSYYQQLEPLMLELARLYDAASRRDDAGGSEPIR